jgi:DNA-binding MarR family transcriptional regulator
VSESAADKPANPDSETERLRAWLRMLKATRRVEAHIREKLRLEFDTTLPRFDVMAALYRFDSGLKMSELSATLRVANGNVTGIVERLVVDGVVLRVPVAGDKRATMVLLTTKGRDEFAAMAASHRRWIGEIFGHLSPNSSEQIAAVMDLISASPAFANDGR